MEKEVTISARISKELAAQLETVSAQYQRSRSWLVEEALRHYVQGEMEYITKVQEGLDDIKAGRVVPHEEVVAMFKKRKRKWKN